MWKPSSESLTTHPNHSSNVLVNYFWLLSKAHFHFDWIAAHAYHFFLSRTQVAASKSAHFVSCSCPETAVNKGRPSNRRPPLLPWFLEQTDWDNKVIGKQKRFRVLQFTLAYSDASWYCQIVWSVWLLFPHRGPTITVINVTRVPASCSRRLHSKWSHQKRGDGVERKIRRNDHFSI